MSKRLERYIQERNFNISAEELKDMDMTRIGIFYGFNNYSCSVQHVLELAEAVRQEYPNISNDDMSIWYLEHSQSIRHAGYTTLYVPIPVDDFIRLRMNNEIGIL